MGWQREWWFVAPRRMDDMGMGWNDLECESDEKEWVAPLLQPQTFALPVKVTAVCGQDTVTLLNVMCAMDEETCFSMFALSASECLTLIMKLTMPNGYTDTTVRLSNG
jgi:hypothetical protein